jgi:type IV pilus assembly protein PilV
MKKIHPPKRQTGLTLIEVLVAILIFSFGLLGFVGLQARAIQFSVSAEDSNRASLLATEIATQMHALQTADPAAPALTATIATWAAKVADPANGGLPNGVGTVEAEAGSANTAKVTLQWQAPSAAAASGAQQNTYITHVVVVPL